MVLVGSSLLTDLKDHLANFLPSGGSTGKAGGPQKCAIVTDEIVAPLYADRVATGLAEAGLTTHVIVLPAGESSKSLGNANRICEKLTRLEFRRNDIIVAVGGGVIGDLAGFAAAVFLRGIRYVNVPTTVTAQCDSSIGGKTGVNTRYGKNLLGAIHPPSLVLADVETLRTLPPRMFNEGCAEIIKHGAALDIDLFEQLRREGTQIRPDKAAQKPSEDYANLTATVQKNIEIKAKIVSDDEFESFSPNGRRTLLNFGHTIGHAIEREAGYGKILHGEAVSIGMVAAGRLSVRKAGLSTGQFRDLVRLLRLWRLPTRLPEGLETDRILRRLRHDKKFVANAIRFVLLESLGAARVSNPGEIDWTDITNAVEGLQPVRGISDEHPLQ